MSSNNDSIKFDANSYTMQDVNTAIQNANNDQGPKILEFGVGMFTFSSPLTPATANNIVFKGQGKYNGGTIFNFTNTTGDDTTFSGQHSGISDIFFCSSVKKTSGFSVKLNGYSSFVKNVRFDFVFNGISIFSCTETRLTGIQFNHLLGNMGIEFKGTSTVGSYRTILTDVLANNPYPKPYPSTCGVKTWTTNKQFYANEITRVNDMILQCTQSGITSSSGYGPILLPGTGGYSVFGTEITDGTVKWKFVCHKDLTWIVMNEYSNSMVLNQCALINGYCGFKKTGSSGKPSFLWAYDLEIDHPYSLGCFLEHGTCSFLNNMWISSSLTDNGMVIHDTYTGECSVVQSRIFGNAKHGIILGNGPRNVLIQSSFISNNSTKMANTYNGIEVASDATHFQICSNFVGNSPSVSGNNQRIGVSINTGLSNYFIVSNNILEGNKYAGIIDNSTKNKKSILGNIS